MEASNTQVSTSAAGPSSPSTPVTDDVELTLLDGAAPTSYAATKPRRRFRYPNRDQVVSPKKQHSSLLERSISSSEVPTKNIAGNPELSALEAEVSTKQEELKLLENRLEGVRKELKSADVRSLMRQIDQVDERRRVQRERRFKLRREARDMKREIRDLKRDNAQVEGDLLEMDHEEVVEALALRQMKLDSLREKQEALGKTRKECEMELEAIAEKREQLQDRKKAAFDAALDKASHLKPHLGEVPTNAEIVTDTSDGEKDVIESVARFVVEKRRHQQKLQKQIEAEKRRELAQEMSFLEKQNEELHRRIDDFQKAQDRPLAERVRSTLKLDEGADEQQRLASFLSLKPFAGEVSPTPSDGEAKRSRNEEEHHMDASTLLSNLQQDLDQGLFEKRSKTINDGLLEDEQEMDRLQALYKDGGMEKVGFVTAVKRLLQQKSSPVPAKTLEWEYEHLQTAGMEILMKRQSEAVVAATRFCGMQILREVIEEQCRDVVSEIRTLRSICSAKLQPVFLPEDGYLSLPEATENDKKALVWLLQQIQGENMWNQSERHSFRARADSTSSLHSSSIRRPGRLPVVLSVEDVAFVAEERLKFGKNGDSKTETLDDFARRERTSWSRAKATFTNIDLPDVRRWGNISCLAVHGQHPDKKPNFTLIGVGTTRGGIAIWLVSLPTVKQRTEHTRNDDGSHPPDDTYRPDISIVRILEPVSRGQPLFPSFRSISFSQDALAARVVGTGTDGGVYVFTVEMPPTTDGFHTQRDLAKAAGYCPVREAELRKREEGLKKEDVPFSEQALEKWVKRHRIAVGHTAPRKLSLVCRIFPEDLLLPTLSTLPSGFLQFGMLEMWDRKKKAVDITALDHSESTDKKRLLALDKAGLIEAQLIREDSVAKLWRSYNQRLRGKGTAMSSSDASELFRKGLGIPGKDLSEPIQIELSRRYRRDEEVKRLLSAREADRLIGAKLLLGGNGKLNLFSAAEDDDFEQEMTAAAAALPKSSKDILSHCRSQGSIATGAVFLPQFTLGGQTPFVVASLRNGSMSKLCIQELGTFGGLEWANPLTDDLSNGILSYGGREKSSARDAKPGTDALKSGTRESELRRREYFFFHQAPILRMVAFDGGCSLCTVDQGGGVAIWNLEDCSEVGLHSPKLCAQLDLTISTVPASETKADSRVLLFSRSAPESTQHGADSAKTSANGTERQNKGQLLIELYDAHKWRRIECPEKLTPDQQYSHLVYQHVGTSGTASNSIWRRFVTVDLLNKDVVKIEEQQFDTLKHSGTLVDVVATQSQREVALAAAYAPGGSDAAVLRIFVLSLQTLKFEPVCIHHPLGKDFRLKDRSTWPKIAVTNCYKSLGSDYVCICSSGVGTFYSLETSQRVTPGVRPPSQPHQSAVSTPRDAVGDVSAIVASPNGDFVAYVVPSKHSIVLHVVRPMDTDEEFALNKTSLALEPGSLTEARKVYSKRTESDTSDMIFSYGPKRNVAGAGKAYQTQRGRCHSQENVLELAQEAWLSAAGFKSMLDAEV